MCSVTTGKCRRLFMFKWLFILCEIHLISKRNSSWVCYCQGLLDNWEFGPSGSSSNTKIPWNPGKSWPAESGGCFCSSANNGLFYSPVISNTGFTLAAAVSSRGLVWVVLVMKNQEGSFCVTIKRVRRASPKKLDEGMLKTLQACNWGQMKLSIDEQVFWAM